MVSGGYVIAVDKSKPARSGELYLSKGRLLGAEVTRTAQCGHMPTVRCVQSELAGMFDLIKDQRCMPVTSVKP